MQAMALHAPGQPLRLEHRADPLPAAGELVLRVEALSLIHI